MSLTDDENYIIDDNLSDNKFQIPNEDQNLQKTNRRKLRASNHIKYLKNPCKSKFNLSSDFIYDIDEYQYYLKTVSNINLIKPKKIILIILRIFIII